MADDSFPGFPADKAPKWLKPWLDAVDGYVITPYPTASADTVRVALFRECKRLGEIEVEHPAALGTISVGGQVIGKIVSLMIKRESTFRRRFPRNGL